MKVYICQEWYGESDAGYWDNVKVMNSHEKALEWVVEDFDNRSYQELEIE